MYIKAFLQCYFHWLVIVIKTQAYNAAELLTAVISFMKLAPGACILKLSTMVLPSIWHSNKDTSLLCYGITYSSNQFYDIGPRSLYIKALLQWYFHQYGTVIKTLVYYATELLTARISFMILAPEPCILKLFYSGTSINWAQ